MTQKAFELQHAGFGIGLADWWSRTADIIVRGQSGYNSRWTLLGFNEILGSFKPDMVVLFLGNNDCSKNGQHVPVDEFRHNMETMVNILRSVSSDIAILLVTPTRADKPDRSDEFTSMYVDVVRDICKQHPRNGLVDLWVGEYSVEKEDLCDGVHLNASGNEKVMLAIKSTIRAIFPEFVPVTDSTPPPPAAVRLQWLFPRWNDFAGKTIEECAAIIDAAKICKTNVNDA